MVRAFVAIDLSDAVKTELGRMQGHLRRSAARLSYVDPSLAHITLLFLGEVEDSRLESVKEALLGIQGTTYDLAVTGVAGNNPRRPRVIWCTVEDGGATARLADAVEGALRPLGFRRDRREFTPHITLARVKEFDPSLLEGIADLADETAGLCTIDRIVLKQSTLTPKGPIYQTLLEVPLGAH
ncbi:RNA 2',3'-cyclic phosphodiesterase [Methanofollis fontis]|uniref:RNA 2',3'-cyclic phosphodiesterase n=1 Tax=Methanofollis fontis TaxID=2052832 RepID=A0A483CYT3_9EURY|nr:RNA 2',3'-cyclic phosphodiesterase [Methanofollis fontis]TAJ44936.1 RNA 2',3'-cyclic phosphodiesterase [Methanofollis fontis]